MDLTQAELKTRLRYRPETGHFYWIKPPTQHPRLLNRRAGFIRTDYVIVKVAGLKFRAHRLAFLYMTGKLPVADVDHINRIGTDNRWGNLRECSRQQNNWNHGRTCIRAMKSGRFQARCAAHGVTHHLGTFATEAEALEAYTQKKHELHGSFA